jgi:hypothetical protein
MAENKLGSEETSSYNLFSLEETPESEKQTPKYSIDIARSIVDKYRKDRTAIGHSWLSFFQELRSYGAGRQDTNKYKTFLASASTTSAGTDPIVNTENNREAAKKGWYSINWQNVVSFLPNILSQISGSFSSLDWDLKADAIDIDSGAEEEERMISLYIDTHPVTGALINDLKQTANIPIQEQSFIPQDLKELEDMKSDGFFKETYIQQHEKLLQHSENRSNWDRSLKDKLLRDITNLGYPFAYVEFDPETCTPIWRYADPERTIMQYDEDDGFANADYAGVLTSPTISQLKQYRNNIVHKDGHKITEEEFAAIAKRYCKYDTNPDESEWNKYNKSMGSGFLYDPFRIEVAKCWWKDVEYLKRIKYTNRYGKSRLYDYKEPIQGEANVSRGDNDIKYPYSFGENYSLSVEPHPGTSVAKTSKRGDGFNVVANTPGKIKYRAHYNIGKGEELKSVRIRKVYTCHWIVNTDFCIKYGVLENQPRYDYSEPLLPIVGWKYPYKAITYRCVPVEDMYQIAWYRLENGIAKASQGGYAINTSLLGDNGKKLDPLKVLKAWRENQVVFYKMGINGNVGGTPVPISYVPGNLAEIMATEISVMERCMQWVTDQTGFSTLSLGASPTQDQAVGTTQQSLAATQTSLRPMMDALQYIKEGLGRRTSSMWQCILQNDPKAAKEAAKIIGEDGVFMLQQARSSGIQMGIHTVARPDDVIKQEIKQSATISFQNKEITSDERLFIIEQLTSGQNPREIRMKLRKMIQENKKKEEAYKQEAIRVQAQELQKTAQLQAESAERIEAARIKATTQEKLIEAKANILVRDHDSYRKIEEMKAQHKLEMGQEPSNPDPGQQEVAPQNAPIAPQMPQQIPQQPVQNAI